MEMNATVKALYEPGASQITKGGFRITQGSLSIQLVLLAQEQATYFMFPVVP